MKTKYIIGNWKSNKNILEAESWFETFRDLYSKNKNFPAEKIEMVLCVPYLVLPLAKKLCDQYKLPLKLGAQDVSSFPNGAYTGEVSASQIAEFAQYTIIGHSERRTKLGEEDVLLFEKVKRAKEAALTSIYCVQDEHTKIAQNVEIVAYEPVWAIGTGKTDTPDNANNVASKIKNVWKGEILLYGGSVTAENVNSFITTASINGVLVGGTSLDPAKFWQMIINAATI